MSGLPASEGGTPVRETFLPFARPTFGEEERREVLEVLDSGWITTGPRVARFEEALAAYTGAAHVVAVDSCTAALHLALAALDLGPGDEVITSPLTFCSTVTSILHAGGTPVLADIEDDTLNLDPVAVARAVTPRTRAVIPVHYGGQPCAMDPIGATAAAHGLAVIEDAAHALGGRYRGRPVGTLGTAACLSFYVTKNITTGEGGAFLTGDAHLAERVRRLSLHGMSRDAWARYGATGTWKYDVVEAGYKYNMTDLEAALGIHQLARLDGFNARRREITGRYDRALGESPVFRIPTRREEVESAYHLYPLRLRTELLSIDRDRFLEGLRAENIGISVHFIPVHRHTAYRDRWAPGSFPVADAAYETLLSLPLYPAMTDADADSVIEALRKLAVHYRR